MSLVGVALLIGLDRGAIAPYWRRPTATSQFATARDRERYHRRQFAVTRVVDGDTIRIDAPDANDSSTGVRLLGIDAPELAHDGAPAMYFAREATDFARQCLQNATVTVYLDADGPTRGHYGRLLAYIELPDGRFLNELLISEGCAYADSRFPHGYYYRYRQLEAGARAAKKGLWAAVTPEQIPTWHRRSSSSKQPD